MKNNSTKQAENGRMPPINNTMWYRKYHGCSGIGRAVVAVITGYSMTSSLYPKYAPKKTCGYKIPTH
jgi:hypothetical protein